MKQVKYWQLNINLLSLRETCQLGNAALGNTPDSKVNLRIKSESLIENIFENVGSYNMLESKNVDAIIDDTVNK